MSPCSCVFFKWAGWEHGLEAIVGEQSTLSHVCRQTVNAVMEGGQGGALPSLFLFLHSVLLWMECVHRICLGWNVISQTDLYLLIASFVSYDSPGPALPLWADWALKCQTRLGIQAVFGVAEGLMVNSLRSSQLTAPGDESVRMQEEQCQMLLTECTHSCHSITLDDLTICPPGGPFAWTGLMKNIPYVVQ